jgi:hypothetical protein
MKHTIKRTAAKVSWNALMIQTDSLSVIPIDPSKAGIATKRAELLNASRDRARQNINNITNLQVRESCFGGPFVNVPAGKSGADGDIVLKGCKRIAQSDTA